jgi:uncharacterized protein (DUF433 family)
MQPLTEATIEGQTGKVIHYLRDPECQALRRKKILADFPTLARDAIRAAIAFAAASAEDDLPVPPVD